MPVFEIENPRTKALVRIEADRQPTDEEAQEALNAFEGAPVATPPPPGPTPEAAFATRFTAAEQAGPLSKIAGRFGTLGEAVSNLVKTVGGGFEGAGALLGEASVNPSTLAPNLAQTGIEAAGRVAFDIANALRQGGRFVQEQPLQAAQALAAPLTTLLPRTPSQQEISDAFQRELANQAFGEVRQAPIAGATLQGTTEGNFGEANIPLAEALPLAVGAGEALNLAKAVEGAIKTIPAVEGAINLGRGAVSTVKGAASMTARKLIPQPLVENIVSTLDPKANAINPAKTVQAVKDTTAAVKRVLPDLTPDDLAHPQTLADNATAKLQEIHAQREALAGGPTPISLDPLADAYEKLAADPVLRVQKPDVIPQLENLAKQYRGKTLSGSDAERLNQYLNAENETLYSQVKQKRETTKKANPIIAANEDAAQALRASLDDAFGDQFGELGKDYGAWRNIADMAQRQAVKQAKIEGRLGLYEGLSALQAIGTGGQPISTALSLAGGQVLKFAGSPLSKFEASARRLSSAIDKGQISPRPPPVIPTPAPVTPIPPTSPVSMAVPPGPPSVTTAVVPTAAPMTLEQQIEALIQTYPPALRKDPKLARIAAEQQLKQGVSVP